MALYPPWFFDNSSLDTGLIINPADDQNAPIGIVAYYTSPGLLLLFYIKIETLPKNLEQRTYNDALNNGSSLFHVGKLNLRFPVLR